MSTCIPAGAAQLYCGPFPSLSIAGSESLCRLTFCVLLLQYLQAVDSWFRVPNLKPESEPCTQSLRAVCYSPNKAVYDTLDNTAPWFKERGAKIGAIIKGESYPK